MPAGSRRYEKPRRLASWHRQNACATGSATPVQGATAPNLFGEGVGAQLEMGRERLGAFATLDEPRRAIAVGGPQAAALPASLGIIYAAVESFGVEPQRI